MHYYQHHIGDFIRATSRLNDAQTMAYLRLLWMYYESEKPLKPDTKILAFQIGTDIETAQLLLEAFFILCADGWHHTRCDQEIQEYRSFRYKKSKAGKASAEQRKNKRLTSDEQVLNECSTDVQLTNNHKPITNKDITPRPPKGATSLDDYLEQCRREGKKPIAEDSPVFTYAKEIGLPHDFLRLQWLEFKARYSLPEAKKYKAWPTVFGKSVRGNWFKLWYVKDDTYFLSTQGLQAQKLHKEAA